MAPSAADIPYATIDPPSSKRITHGGGTILRGKRTTVTGAVLRVVEREGRRLLYLGDLCQSEAVLDVDGSVSIIQDWELIQCISLVALAWLRHSPNAFRRALVLGVGGGNLVRLFQELLPAESFIRGVELEPEVIAAAEDYFGLRPTPFCDIRVGDAMDQLALQSAAGQQGEKYHLIVLDCFTADGLASRIADGSAMEDAAACLLPEGICIVDLHTAHGVEALTDHDYAVAMRVLHHICSFFDCVYKLDCASSLNLIGICHFGELRDIDQWETMIGETLDDERIRKLCPGFQLAGCLERLDFVGGRSDPPQL
mmetsp:Transcript_15226/g.32540  ORF Transcript_15226/g.32540 Transcript_15226/m.32540 type:complete len:312 (+) Transcript_15226:83-1018(+)|eukprot:477867-Pleurochrysis_carterae.AAC.2